MRTGHSLTVCRGGGPCQGVSLPGGVLPAGRGSPTRGVSLLGVLLARGGCQGGLLARGFSLSRGVLPARGGGLAARGGSPCQGGLPARGVLPAGDPPVNRMTDTSKNITLATTSLRPVTKFCDRNKYTEEVNFIFHYFSDRFWRNKTD